MKNINDGDLNIIKEVLDGKKESFSHIVRKYKDFIYYIGLKFFGNKEEAFDFSQEVFINIFVNLSTFKGNSRFSLWLYKVAYNMAINYKRNKWNKWIQNLAEYNVDNIASKDKIEKGILNKELIKKVNTNIEKLPEIYQLLVKMHYIDDLQYNEISDIIDMPVNTIKSYIFRAKNILRKSLEGYYLRGD